ncbi:MAG: 30S ribosomal protein S17e [Candidatus Jordarchaeales archaeon]
MGKVRPTYVKRVARQIMAEYGHLVTDNFEENKKLLNELALIRSKKLRNKVAGYLVRLVKLSREEYVYPTAEERRSEEEYEREIQKYAAESKQAEEALEGEEVVEEEAEEAVEEIEEELEEGSE